jgi:hypothetical protein
MDRCVIYRGPAKLTLVDFGISEGVVRLLGSPLYRLELRLRLWFGRNRLNGESRGGCDNSF